MGCGTFTPKHTLNGIITDAFSLAHASIPYLFIYCSPADHGYKQVRSFGSNERVCHCSSTCAALMVAYLALRAQRCMSRISRLRYPNGDPKCVCARVFERILCVFELFLGCRIETLDPALIRPGRIDRKIEFPLPDVKTKRMIFKIHTGRMSLAEDVDLEEFIMVSCGLMLK